MLVQQEWPRVCGTDLLCQHFRLLTCFPVTHCGRWVCTPQGEFLLAQASTEHSVSQESIQKRSKSTQVCSVPGKAVNPAPFVPMFLRRVQNVGRLPWTWTSSVWRGEDLTPWCTLHPCSCPLSHSTNLLCPDHWFVTCSAFYINVSLSVISFPDACDSRYTTPIGQQCICLQS